ncbi:hypothetical protein [Amycolatopsis sp. Hca4]|uniref:hypothetical protein n=1 Tax=Amycolatopsis sp. Hca4 TaxID=2742131 RepID=UPI00158FA069|nr:hypothetical protein [Amycolatopsis sp. Hca4]QKV74168.1 hypothetical protein HUT10_10630 [Amycolatopsis sp. Hca4]
MSTTDTGELARAVGAELQRQRENRGWSRPAIAAWSQGRVTPRALATWEKATRSMSLRQLGAAALLYQLRPSELLAHAERRIAFNPDLTVDIAALAATHHDALHPAARWAQHLLNVGEPPFRSLNLNDLAVLADRCHLTIAHLAILLTAEAPVHP